MAKKNPQIDAYIKKSPDFAKPILKHLRKVIHKTCPQVVEEMKWNSPFYLYQGRILCATMAFKKHCAVVFWKTPLIVKKKGAKAKAHMKHMRKMTMVEDLLPDKEFAEYLKLAMHFNEPTTKLPPREKRTTVVKPPNDLMDSLRANPTALKNFNAFTPSKRKDYIYWILSAKTDPTREARIETSIDWISEGKSRNWKYEMTKKKKK
ncbi:MAG: YdeI/OmpD-associated family protein [Bdellovibrionales bacterium]|nr:YdeI/OmpD-associated family protein [Bdellovibrionales bacterium]